MLVWVINIMNYLSDSNLDSDIVGADRFGLSLVIAGWVLCDIILGSYILISLFVRRNRKLGNH